MNTIKKTRMQNYFCGYCSYEFQKIIRIDDTGTDKYYVVKCPKCNNFLKK